MGFFGSLMKLASEGISNMAYENYFLPYRRCDPSDLAKIAKADYEYYENTGSSPKLIQRVCALLPLAEHGNYEAKAIYEGEDKNMFFNQFKSLYKSRKFQIVLDNVSEPVFGFKPAVLR